MIKVRIDSAFAGLITEKRTVRTIIYSAFTMPHKNWRTPERSQLTARFDVMKTFKVFSIAAFAFVRNFLVSSSPIYYTSTT